MSLWVKRLLGLSPWSRMYRKAFLNGFEEGLNAATQINRVVVGHYDHGQAEYEQRRTLN